MQGYLRRTPVVRIARMTDDPGHQGARGGRSHMAAAGGMAKKKGEGVPFYGAANLV